jgi:hypothetical protein
MREYIETCDASAKRETGIKIIELLGDFLEAK